VKTSKLLARMDRRLDLMEEHVHQSTEYMRQGSEYMRQGNEYMRQGNEYMRQGNEQMREFRVALEDNTQAIADLRTTLNQWNLRQEKMMREVLAVTVEVIATLREFRSEGMEEARAQRATLFAILDELKGGGASPA
jgi:septal ring factor EnvC (AmiA/AmiB activator)